MIAFFYPSNKIGGAQLLFARLSSYFLSLNMKVLIIDYKDGFVINYLKREGRDPIFKEYNGTLIKVKEKVCLVQHLSSAHTLQRHVSLSKDSTLIFWSIHPHNILSLMRFTPVYTRAPLTFSRYFSSLMEPRRKLKIRRLLNQMYEKSALYFMDEANAKPSKTIKLLNKDVEYLPIPVLQKNFVKIKNEFNSINVAWVGRVTDEKIIPFNYVLDQLEENEKAPNITFHIIGYGDLSHLEKIKNIKIVEYGIVNSGELSRLLLDKVDCVFAMGTSVLESAILGIPSILVDLSKNPFPKNYKFKWIFETNNYTLGSEAKDFTGTLSMTQVLEQLSTRSKYHSIAQECRSYAKNNHSIANIGSKLLKASKQSSFTFHQLQQF